LSKETKKKDDIANPVKRIKAVSLYSPKIIQPKTADTDDLVARWNTEHPDDPIE
jgi:hypothetical protein